MDKETIQYMAKELCSEMRTVDYFYKEADGTLATALTKLWNEALKAAEITVGPSMYLGKEQVARVREKIRRLRIEE